MDYVGADGSQANNLSGSFYPDSPASFFADSPGGPSSWTTTALRCQNCHNPTTDPLTTAGLTKVVFAGDFTGNFVNNTGSLSSGSVDKSFGICVQCHQSGYSNSGLGTAPAQVDANIVAKVGKGVTYAVVTAPKDATVTNGQAGVGGFVLEGDNAHLAATGLTQGAYTGYTAIFRGDATPALNGVRTAVSGNTATSVAFTGTLPATPRSAVLKAITSSAPVVAASGTTTTVTRSSTWSSAPAVGSWVYFATGACSGKYLGPVSASSTTQVTYPADASACVPSAGDTFWLTSTVADSAILYPTATSGSATQLFDTNRDQTVWTANAWQGYLVRFLSGANAGVASVITASDTSSITFAALSKPVAAGDLYEIVPNLAADLDGNAGIGNVSAHRLEAGATLYGNSAAGWYQYAGKTYAPTFTHGAGATANGSCITCHNPHTLEIKLATCQGCHGTDANATVNPMDPTAVVTWSAPAGISYWTATPFNTKQDIDTLAATLASTLQGKGVCFTPPTGGTGVTPKAYAGGVCNGTVSLTPRTLRASFNYGLYLQGDPGAWAHNPDYVKQVLYDSITDLGGTPPTVPVPNRP
jgi:hypothetical protein